MDYNELLRRARYYLNNEIKDLNKRLSSPLIEHHKRKELEAALKRKYKLLSYYNKRL